MKVQRKATFGSPFAFPGDTNRFGSNLQVARQPRFASPPGPGFVPPKIGLTGGRTLVT